MAYGYLIPQLTSLKDLSFDNELMVLGLGLAMTLALKLERFDYVSTICIAEPLIQQG
jgi:hypothetical protein